MTEYTFSKFDNTQVLRSGDDAYVPWDAEAGRPADEHGLAMQQWLDDGSPVPAAYVAPPPSVPDSASRLGLMRALREIGKWDAAKAAIASNAEAQEEWDLAISIKRDDPLTGGIIQALGLTSADVDQLLVRAAALTS